MPDMNEQVYNVLAADPALTALVGNKIWALFRAQEEALPALVFWRVSTTPVAHALGSDELTEVRYQLDCYSASLPEASAIAFAARAALEAAFNSIHETRLDRYNIQTRDYTVSIDITVWGDDIN